MNTINAGIVGGAGYTGGELIRLLLQHPKVHIAFVNSSSNAGNPVYAVHGDLLGETELLFTDDFESSVRSVDIIFLCLGHGAARRFLEKNHIPDTVRIVDLSQDFRLKPDSVFKDQDFVYGLPELNKAAIAQARYIANPGCFATAIQLGLLPLAQEGLLGDVYTTGITGSTGAGQQLSATTHFSWRVNNISAYKTLEHQHIAEIAQSVQQLQPGLSLNDKAAEQGIWFVPWRGDFARGIYVSSTLDCTLSLEELYALYAGFYADAAVTHMSEAMIDMKQVVNTNKCLVHIEKSGRKIVVHTAIDNLLKGASGQAVQNMNLMFGWAEKTGLGLKASGF